MVSGAAAALVTGCSSPSPQENVSQACSASEAFGAAVKTFQDTLTTDATVEEVQTAREGVRSTYATLVNEAGDVAQDRMAELATATNELNAAVDAVPSDAALTDALGSLKNEAADVVNARNDVDNAPKC
jgi:outer membrane murein-binding lipoprotein Lpp